MSSLLFYELLLHATFPDHSHVAAVDVRSRACTIRDLADSSINESINIQHAIRPDTSTSTSGTAIDALQLCDVLQLSNAITSIEQQLCDVLRRFPRAQRLV